MTLKQESVHLGACPKQCIKIEGVFLNRALCILGFFCPKRSGLQTLISSSPLPKYWLEGYGLGESKKNRETVTASLQLALLSLPHRYKPLGLSLSTFKTQMVARNYNGNRSVLKTILRKNGQRTMNSIR